MGEGLAVGSAMQPAGVAAAVDVDGVGCRQRHQGRFPATLLTNLGESQDTGLISRKIGLSVKKQITSNVKDCGSFMPMQPFAVVLVYGRRQGRTEDDREVFVGAGFRTSSGSPEVGS